MNSDIIYFLLPIVLGYQIGVLAQRWVYFNKTGKHLQDVKKID
jgi:hypothetical protein